MPQPSLPIFQISEQNLLLVVLLEDAPLHTNEHPFCLDPECPCKEDETLNRMFLTKPLDNGLLTNSEALRIYFGTQLTPTQDGERITDEEIEAIMSGDANNQEADEPDMSKHDWLSEHL